MSNPFSDDAPNPYSSPDPKSFSPEGKPFDTGADPGGYSGTMDYFGAFSRIMANPNWFMNILLGGLIGVFLACLIIGPIVLLGYSFLAAEWWHRTRGARYPDFDFNKFGDYLGRGAGPFLVGLLSGIVQYVIVQVVMFPLTMALGLSPIGADGGEADPAKVFTLLGINFAVSISLSIIFGFLVWPLQIRSELSNDIGQAFNIKWAFDFVSKCWLEIVFAAILGVLMNFAVAMLGYLALCIGIIPAVGFISLINAWLSMQLYQLYLSRGGEPIPLKPLEYQP